MIPRAILIAGPLLFASVWTELELRLHARANPSFEGQTRQEVEVDLVLSLLGWPLALPMLLNGRRQGWGRR